MGKCETCKWWSGRISGQVHTRGPCRRYPPTMVVRDRYDDLQQHSPMMAFNDFCGEHQPKEPT